MRRDEAFRGASCGVGHPRLSRRASQQEQFPGMPHPPGKAASKEGDAFLARLRMWDVLLLMEDGPYSTRALGMRHPYEQAVRDGARSIDVQGFVQSALIINSVRCRRSR